MADKNIPKKRPSFFARLFGKKPFRVARKAAQAPEGAPHARPDRPDGKPLKLAPEQRASAPKIPLKPATDPYKLALPVDHVVYELWRLCREQHPQLARPEITFRTAEPQVLTPDNAEYAQIKLKAAITSSAAARLDAATPKAPPPPPPAPEGQEPQPAPQPEPVDLDFQAVVFVAADQQSAWMLLYPPVGAGAAPTQAILRNALGAAGITFGLDENKLSSIPADPDPYFRLHLIAQGKPAVHGEDGKVTDLFPRTVHKELPVDEFNRVDFTAMGTTQNVEKGAVICQITLPTPGVPGRTVTGQELSARDGVPAVPPMGRNTALSDDGTALIATRDGGLEFSAHAFQVNPLREIAGNVDYSCGNVNFLGDVHIHGDVCSGFTVRAMGNIKVDGVVESATIEAGGDLTLSKGVQGNSQAVIRAHRDIFAKYLENCTAYAQGNLHSECIVNCQVYCDGGVYVQKGRGAIMGGSICAAREVDANAVGTKTEVPTEVTLGGLPCEDFERGQLIQQIEELEQSLADMDRQPDSPAKSGRMAKLRMQISVNKLKLNQYNKSLEELQNSTEKRPAGRLTFRTAYGGTRVSISGAVLQITDETRHSTAVLADGEVKLIT